MLLAGGSREGVRGCQGGGEGRTRWGEVRGRRRDGARGRREGARLRREGLRGRRGVAGTSGESRRLPTECPGSELARTCCSQQAHLAVFERLVRPGRREG